MLPHGTKQTRIILTGLMADTEVVGSASSNETSSYREERNEEPNTISTKLVQIRSGLS